MKKILITMSIMSALVMTAMVSCFAEEYRTPENRPPRAEAPDFKAPPKGPEFEKRKAEFEARLNLTEEQKNKAKQMREAGHKNMEPLMKAIQTKHEELRAIKAANSKTQNEEIEKIQSELRELHKKAHEERMKNMKEFESILTKEQLKELEKMKEEGRKNFEKRPPRQGFEGPMPPKD